MKNTISNNILLKTNLLVCLLIITGFITVAVMDNLIISVSYRDNIQYTSDLSSESIFYRLESIFAKPISTSLSMAANPFLKELLQDEAQSDNSDYDSAISDYLSVYQAIDDYESVFLVTASTDRYYTSGGLNRVLTADNPENDWYYEFLNSKSMYALNIDNDEAALNEITVFVNCRITDEEDNILGIIGVGFHIDYLQKLLREYAEKFGKDIYLINEQCNIEVAIDNTGWQPVNFFDVCGYPEYKAQILSVKDSGGNFSVWIPEKCCENYITVKYVPELSWFLIIEHNTILLVEQLKGQFLRTAATVALTSSVVVLVITYVIRRHNRRVVDLVVLIEQEKYAETKSELIHKAERDGLTYLYNKTATEDHIEETLSGRPESYFAFFIVDLDDLKQINDQFGHAFGDIAISEVSAVIKKQFRENDIIGRIGGDEFVVFAPVSNMESVEKKAAELSAALNTKISDGSVQCGISASIGIALAPRDGTYFVDLYKKADIALYQTKNSGKNSYTMYTGES